MTILCIHFNPTPPLLTVDPPTIATQPQGMLNVIPGSNATFMVAATGLRLNYTWKQGDGSALCRCDKFVPDNNLLTIQNVQSSDVGSYYCVVSNAAGSVTSNSASLTLSELYIYRKLGHHNHAKFAQTLTHLHLNFTLCPLFFLLQRRNYCK